jgi:phospholipid transport system substrate-binding protein
VDTRGPDKLVHTQLVSSSGSPVDLAYRMRQASGGQWKVIDVYFNGSISQLSQQKADYASTLSNGGAQALVKKIDALSAKQAAG